MSEEMQGQNPEREELELLERAVAKLSVRSAGWLVGLLSGVALFVATNWLVIKGGPNVGQHLSLLGNYFPGYTVTFVGSLIGFAYAFLAGALAGSFLAWVYNLTLSLRRRSSL